MRVLVVDDDREIAGLLARDFDAQGYTVDTVGLAEHALAAASDTDYALMVVDLGLPDGDGLDLVREIRRRGSHMPILVLTARRRVEDRVVGLATGADDYLVKPFALPELRARVGALLRRPALTHRAIISIADIVVDRDALSASVAGVSLDLTRKQFVLLELLVRRKHQLTPKRMIEEALYGYDDTVSSNAIEAQIYKLRVALRTASANATIETRRGIGYRLVETDGTAAWGAELTAGFLSRLENDRLELTTLAARLGAGDDPLQRLAQLAHRLAGAAGTYGFRSLGIAAALLEDTAAGPARLTGAERIAALTTTALQTGRLVALIDAVLEGAKAAPGA
jgi:DNA-binding response OmpR family regulator/HPt (histidine-containing phosphotransfer) domain-containing protein